jgi:hypothetical protein
MIALGNALQGRFESSNATTDLDRALILYKNAEDTTSSNSDRSLCLVSMSHALSNRFRVAGSHDDLDAAILVVPTASNRMRPNPPVQSLDIIKSSLRTSDMAVQADARSEASMPVY